MNEDPWEERFPGARDAVAPTAHTACLCAACKDWREHEDLSQGRTVCFSDIMGETGTGGHGQCIDPWNTGCVCTGTGADGECEGCWLWMK